MKKVGEGAYLRPVLMLIEPLAIPSLEDLSLLCVVPLSA
jgi:hypothetical protein